MYHYHHHPFPCLHCHPHSYIRMVQSLIERCLLLNMDREQCVKALARHARIRPLVTLTVWRELQKENKGFFHQYLTQVSRIPNLGRHGMIYPRNGRRSQWK
nr:uncharacterized protein LOC109157426 [Ipomoea trifida]